MFLIGSSRTGLTVVSLCCCDRVNDWCFSPGKYCRVPQRDGEGLRTQSETHRKQTWSLS